MNDETNSLARVRECLSGGTAVSWIVGGAGSGKTTVSRILSTTHAIPVYDMDAHVYGEYHGRFTAERHPANHEWSQSQNGLAWLLGKTWDEFDAFNRAALVEYLDLLCEDLRGGSYAAGILVDGGICNPAILARVLPVDRLVCVAAPPSATSKSIWEGNDERLQMKGFMDQFPEPEKSWSRFLDFDRRITQTILDECSAAGITICTRDEDETPSDFTARVSGALALNGNR